LILEEKSPGGGRGFFCPFWGVFEGGFGKCVFFVWWNCGELWSIDHRSVAGQKYAKVLKYFSRCGAVAGTGKVGRWLWVALEATHRL
jgi:hypothetical protein